MITDEDKELIINKIPVIELSYETVVHKKVFNYELIVGIPEGQKCFAWFTKLKEKNICVILELDNKNLKKIRTMRIAKTNSMPIMHTGTLFYGTTFNHINHPFFCIEDIFFNKNQNTAYMRFNKKINIICDILKNNIKQIASDNNYLVFGLPIISNSASMFDDKLKTIKYKLSSVQYYNKEINKHATLSFQKYISDEFNIINKKNFQTKTTNITNNNYSNKTNTFLIKPDTDNDIYHIYSLNNDYIGVACISDFQTSVFMNSLFRNIKENNDLDALEHSDDEDEFEDSNANKFVYLEKSHKMLCGFNNKFKKWYPIKVM